VGEVQREWRAGADEARLRLRHHPDDLDAASDLSRHLREGVFEYVTSSEPDIDESQARAAADEAVAAARSVVEAMPADAGALAGLFFALHAQAEVLSVSSSADAVAAYWEAAVVGQRRLAVDEDPEQVRLELSWTLRDAGALMSHDSAEGSAMLEQSVELARAHLSARPDDLEATRELAWVLMVAAEHCAEPQPGRALTLYRESVLAATRVHDAEPDDDGARRDLWLALTGVADLLEPDDPAAAEAIHRQAAELDSRPPGEASDG
jgi:hypothetical protein